MNRSKTSFFSSCCCCCFTPTRKRRLCGSACLPTFSHVVRCNHSPTKTQRISTTIRSSFFPCSGMFPRGADSLSQTDRVFGKNQGARRPPLSAMSLFKNTWSGELSQKSSPVLFRLGPSTCLPLQWIRWAAEDASAASRLYYARAKGRLSATQLHVDWAVHCIFTFSFLSLDLNGILA